MCDRILRRVRAAVALTVFPLVAAAQAEDPLANVRRATSDANAAFAEARAAWTADSVRRSTLEVLGVFGGVAVRTDGSEHAAGIARDLGLELARLRLALERLLGPHADSMLARSTASVVYDHPSSRWLRFRRVGATVRLHLDGSTSSRFFSERGARERAVMRKWLDAAARDAIVANTAAALRPWPNAAPSLQPWTDDERATVYRGLRLNRSPVAQACHDGSLAACRVALALVGDADTVALWYDAPLQRAMIATRGRDTVITPFLGPLHRACVEQGDDRTCREMLVGAGVQAPLGSLARSELLRLALVTGGPSAYERLRSAEAGVTGATLEIISGTPMDSLLHVLHAEILRGRPPSPAPDVQTLFVASAWVVLSLAVVRRRRIAP